MTTTATQISALNYYVLAKGIPIGGAIALVSVLYYESKLDPGSQGYQSTETPGVLNPHGAYGIASWNGPRQNDLLAYATKNGIVVSALDTQLAFVLTEIANGYPGSWSAIRSNASYKGIIPILVDEYENPKNKTVEIDGALAIGAALAALPQPQPAQPAPIPQVPAPQVPVPTAPPSAAPAGPPPISSTIAGMDAAILDHFGAILDALTKQRDAINVRIAKIQTQAAEFATLEGTPTAQLSPPANPPVETTPAKPEGQTTMPVILTNILTSWATSALGSVAGGSSVIDVIQNPANWQHDLPGIATVLLGFVAKDGWVTGGTKQAPVSK